MSLENKVILVTGGTGSFGQKFIEVLLRDFNPKIIRILSRGELLQMQMRQRFNDDSRLRFFIGDVRDRERIYRAMNGVNIVVHAAALKQVPTAEYNPIEAVRTNIDGTINIIDAAIDNGVEKAIAISSDKAVHPVNLYGATKLVMERLFIQANAYTGGRETRFSCVRYGNVIGSRGSVIPLFLEQGKSGKITITDKRMTRFWISIERGVHFVVDCIGRMEGGEVFIPKIPSMRLTDLAAVIAPGVKQEIVGMRAGERLHEILLPEEEARHTQEFDDYFVIAPDYDYASWRRHTIKSGKPTPAHFTYSSDKNSRWLTKEEMKRILEEL